MSQDDDKLNPLSTNFDPLAALYSSNVVLPDPSAPVFDNLTKFEVSESGIRVKELQIKKEEPKVKKELTPPPEEIPSTSQSSAPEPSKNVLSFMKEVQGPLACLRDSVERGARIKVTTRSAQGIRGHLVARLTAFDKMWNLALEEVTEVWTRKRKKKTPCLKPTSGVPAWRVRVPEVNVTPLDRKSERCQRYVPKLMMRGEHVVHIQLIE